MNNDIIFVIKIFFEWSHFDLFIIFLGARNALGSDTPLSEDLMNKVNQTKKRIPVLRDLRTEALKERHWKQVRINSNH